MNLQEIISEINKNVDDELDNSESIGWINRCMEELTPIANNQSITTLDTFADQSQYDLPTDFINVEQVIYGGTALRQVALSDTRTCGYKIYANKIILQPAPTEDGSLDLYYESNLPYLSDLEDIPQIPVFFHDLFVLYAMTKFMYKDDELTRKADAQSDYNIRKREFIRYMNRSAIEPIKDVYPRWV